MVETLRRGAIWWADLGVPTNSEPGYRRPVLVIQDDYFNKSNLTTVIVLSFTSNLRYENFPGNIRVSKDESGLEKDSVLNVTQLTTIDKSWLEEYVSDLPPSIMVQLENGLSLVLGL